MAKAGMVALEDGGPAVVDREAGTVTASRVLPFAAIDVFDVVARPGLHPLLDGSGTVRRGAFGPERLTTVGDRFGMFMRQWGVPYPMVNWVREFDEGRLLAWSHVAGHRWRYRFEPVDGAVQGGAVQGGAVQGGAVKGGMPATRVLEQFDAEPARLPARLYDRAGFLEGHAASLPRSLERLEGVVRSRIGDG